MRDRQKECDLCGEPIVWVTTHKGRAMPLDPEPVEKGSFIYDGPEEEKRVVWIGERDRYTGPRYDSHFATCAHAREARRKP